MKRGEAIRLIGLVTGGVVSGITSSALARGFQISDYEPEKDVFSSDEFKQITKIVDLIIPRSETPGAVDAKVPEFISMMIVETYPPGVSILFHEGLEALNEFCREKWDDQFLKLDEKQQHTAIENVDRLIIGGEKVPKKYASLEFYRILKELTVLGFFSSEEGATQALRYVQTPGAFSGCEPHKNEEKAWFSPGQNYLNR